MAHRDDPPDLPLVECGEWVLAPDGARILGWLEVEDRCADCGAPQVYAVLFDARLCMPCNRWLEESCDDHECDYCRRRPERPLDEHVR